jgi:plasmid maintenance system antidote protein VapI
VSSTGTTPRRGRRISTRPASVGAARLLDWIGTSGTRATDVAVLLAMDRSHLYRILTGRAEITVAEASRIRDLAGVPIEAWAETV